MQERSSLQRIASENRTYYVLLPLLQSRSVLRAEKKIKIYKTLIRPVATFGAEFWTLNKDIAEPPVAFERKVLSGM